MIVQLEGNDPSVILQAAQCILKRTNSIPCSTAYAGPISGIDLNCGCPQAIARRGRYGAFFINENLKDVCEVVSKLRKSLPENLGVSVKMRIPMGWDDGSGH